MCAHPIPPMRPLQARGAQNLRRPATGPDSSASAASWSTSTPRSACRAGRCAVARFQTRAQMHASIVAGFRARPRWAGFYRLYGDARTRGPCCACCFRAVIDAMVDAKELFRFADPHWGYERYLWYGVQSTAKAACARAELEAIREGGAS